MLNPVDLGDDSCFEQAPDERRRQEHGEEVEHAVEASQLAKVRKQVIGCMRVVAAMLILAQVNFCVCALMVGRARLGPLSQRLNVQLLHDPLLVLHDLEAVPGFSLHLQH